MKSACARAAIQACAALGAFAAVSSAARAQSATPVPTPPQPSCAHPNLPATAVQAATALTPPMAEQQGIKGDVQVVVTLDADSHVIATRILSSPNAVLNAEALAAARRSSFNTEVRDCRPIATNYIYTVRFTDPVVVVKTAAGESTLTVVAQGTVKRAPNAAVVAVKIVTHDDAPDKVTGPNDAAYDELKANLRALGINEGSIHATSVLSMHPNAAGVGREYSYTREVEITVDAVPNAGRVAAAAARFKPVDAVSIRYELSNAAAAYREALGVALKNAETTARDQASFQRWALGALKEYVVPPNDARQTPIHIVPYHLVPVVGGLQQPEVLIPDLEVRAVATVTFAVKP
jgi:TonB family protein